MRSAAASANYGTATTLRTQKTSTASIHSYLKFRVTGVTGSATAKLRLWVSDPSPAGGALFRVTSNSWTESTITWGNKPATGTSALATAGAVRSGTWLVLSAGRIATDGTYSFALKGASADAASYSSSEGTNSPQLVLTLPSAPVAGFSATPTSGMAPLTVAFTDTSTGSPTSWTWTFGDGTTSTDRHPSHTYTTAGSYTVTLAAVNEHGSDEESKPAHITVASRFHCGTITQNETWAAGVVHQITCPTTIGAGVHVTILPGAIVKSHDSSLGVDGTLTVGAAGTTSVVMTSWHDDSAGGDTDGQGRAPAVGDWTLNVGSGGTLNLRRADFRFVKMSMNSGTISAARSSFTEAVVELTRGAIAITSSTFTRARLELRETAKPLLQDNTFVDGGDLETTRRYPVFMYSIGDLADVRRNTTTGTGRARVIDIVASTVATSWTVDPGAVYAISNVLVASGGTMTVGPGALVKSSGLGAPSVLGTLAVAGTATDLAVMTAAADDSNRWRH